MPGVMENTAARRWSDAAIFGPARIAWPLRLAAIALASMVLSTLLVFAIEWIVRGSFTDTMQFFRTPHKPAWTTVALFVVVLTASDAIFGRIHYGFIVVGPLALIAATTAREKAFISAIRSIRAIFSMPVRSWIFCRCWCATGHGARWA